MSVEIKKRIFVGANDRITPNENHLVDLKTADGRLFEKLELRRLFPVSNTENYITLLDSDGNEAAIIRNLKDLDPDSFEVITNSLNDYYLVPYITAILSSSEKYGTLHWKAETTRGIKEFDIRNRNHDIRIYSDGCVRIRDSDDNRYVISDYRKLDRHSQSYLIPDL